MSAERKSNQIVRYEPATRINHWIVAISFVLLALSGLALFHPALFWLTDLFGGGSWTRILHPFIGLVMVVMFAVLAAKMWRDNASPHSVHGTALLVRPDGYLVCRTRLRDAEHLLDHAALVAATPAPSAARDLERTDTR